MVLQPNRRQAAHQTANCDLFLFALIQAEAHMAPMHIL
jgi:hypothetical protein